MLRTQYYTTNTAEMQEKKSLIYKNRQYFSKIVSRHKKSADVCGFFVRRYCLDKNPLTISVRGFMLLYVGIIV